MSVPTRVRRPAQEYDVLSHDGSLTSVRKMIAAMLALGMDAYVGTDLKADTFLVLLKMPSSEHITFEGPPVRIDHQMCVLIGEGGLNVASLSHLNSYEVIA